MNSQHDPIFFTPPYGDSKRPRRLHKGGDGGASKQAAADEKTKAEARSAVNRIFGIGTDAPPPVAPDQASFMRAGATSTTPSNIALGLTNRATSAPAVLDAAGYSAAMQKYNDDLASYKPVNAVKDARENVYKDASDAVRAFNINALDKNAALEGRNLRFQLARQGIVGGSEDINQTKQFGELYDKGRLYAQNAGDTTASQLRTADESTRLNLINSINAGTDSTSAISGANTALQNNLNTVKSDNLGQTIGNVFDDSSLITKAAQAAAAGTNGMTAQQVLQQRNSVRTPNTSSFGGKTNSY